MTHHSLDSEEATTFPHIVYFAPLHRGHIRMTFCLGTPKWESRNCPETVLVATPLWDKCEGEAHTPKSGKLESSRTPENSEFNFRGQISSHSSVLYVIGKVLKCRCPKWPRMSHLDIFSPSYGQKKGQESNWQFDSRRLKVRNRPLLDVCSRSSTWRWKALDESYNFGSNLVPIQAQGKKL